MKHFILLSSLILCTSTFAASNLTDDLSAAWKQQQQKHAQLDPNDKVMSYGGADISSKPQTMLASTLL